MSELLINLMLKPNITEDEWNKLIEFFRQSNPREISRFFSDVLYELAENPPPIQGNIGRDQWMMLQVKSTEEKYRQIIHDSEIERQAPPPVMSSAPQSADTIHEMRKILRQFATELHEGRSGDDVAIITKRMRELEKEAEDGRKSIKSSREKISELEIEMRHNQNLIPSLEDQIEFWKKKYHDIEQEMQQLRDDAHRATIETNDWRQKYELCMQEKLMLSKQNSAVADDKQKEELLRIQEELRTTSESLNKEILRLTNQITEQDYQKKGLHNQLDIVHSNFQREKQLMEGYIQKLTDRLESKDSEISELQDKAAGRDEKLRKLFALLQEKKWELSELEKKYDIETADLNESLGQADALTARLLDQKEAAERQLQQIKVLLEAEKLSATELQTRLAELHVQETSSLQSQIEKLQTDLLNVTSQLRDSRYTNQDLTVEKNQLKKRAEELRSRLESLQSDMDNHFSEHEKTLVELNYSNEKKIADLQSHIQACEKEKKSLEERLHQCEKNRVREKAEMTQSSEVVKQQQEYMYREKESSQQGEIDRLNAKIAELDAKLKKAVEELQGLTTDRDTVQQNWDKDHAKLTEKLNEAEAKLRDCLEHQEELKREMDTAVSEGKHEHAAALQQQHDELDNVKNELLAEIERLKAEKEDIVKMFQDNIEKMDQAKKEIVGNLEKQKELLQTQIKTLEEQKQKLEEEIKILTESTGSDALQKQNKIKELEDQLAKLQQQHDEESEKLKAIEAEHDQHKEESTVKHASLDAEIARLSEELAKCQKEREKFKDLLERALAHDEESMKEFQEKSNALQTSIEKLETDIKQLLMEKAALEEKNQNLEADKVLATGLVESLKKEIEDLKTELDSAKQSLADDIKQLRSDSNKSDSEKQMELDKLKDMLQNAIVGKTEFEEQLKAAQAKLQETQDNLHAKETELEKVKSEHAKAEAKCKKEIEDLEQKLQRAEEELRMCKEEQEKLRKEMNEAVENGKNEHAGALATKHEEFELEKARLQALIEQLNAEKSALENAHKEEMSIHTDKIKKVEEELAASRARATELESEKKVIEDKLSSCEAEKQKLEDSISDLNTRIASKDTQITAITEELKLKEAQLAECQKEKEQLQKDLEKLNLEIASKSTEITKITKTLTLKEALLEECTNERTTLVAKLEEATNLAQEYLNEKKQLTETVQADNFTIDAQKMRIETLTTAIQKNTKQISELQAQIDELKRSSTPETARNLKAATKQIKSEESSLASMGGLSTEQQQQEWWASSAWNHEDQKTQFNIFHTGTQPNDSWALDNAKWYGVLLAKENQAQFADDIAELSKKLKTKMKNPRWTKFAEKFPSGTNQPTADNHTKWFCYFHVGSQEYFVGGFLIDKLLLPWMMDALISFPGNENVSYEYMRIAAFIKEEHVIPGILFVLFIQRILFDVDQTYEWKYEKVEKSNRTYYSALFHGVFNLSEDAWNKAVTEPADKSTGAARTTRVTKSEFSEFFDSFNFI